jgi:hypothetical protein
MSGLPKSGNLFILAALGLGAAILGPIIWPRLRPLAKSAVKGALVGLDQGRTAVSKLTLASGDFIAEVRHEMGLGDMFISGVPQPPKRRDRHEGVPAAPPPPGRPGPDQPIA